MNKTVFSSGERMVLTTMACALGCMVISILVGAAGAISYVPVIGPVMADVGVSLAQLRPLHTTFASAWLYLGCVAGMYAYLVHAFGEPSRGDRLRYRVHMVCWGVAGIGVIVSLLLGYGSGREYLGFHPVFSVLIIAGWLSFLWTFLRRVLPGFWARPVYVYMWTAGSLYFVYTFAEGHAYLLPSVAEHPVADLQIQWKSCGALVASFNQMVYGTLIFVGERVSGDRRAGQTRATFALFGLGLLNSFTNYTHHTYHLPQDPLVKWIAFTVSMMEIVILWIVLSDLVARIGARRELRSRFVASTHFFTLSKSWNAFLLPVALLISIPPLNSVIHGTHVVMAHAMGSEIAIDTYILLGAFAWLFAQVYPKREVVERVIDSSRVRRAIRSLNTGMIVLVGCLLVRGVTVGVTRYLGRPAPEWLDVFPVFFVLSGLTVGYSLLRLVMCWLPLFRDPLPHKLFRHDPRWPELVAPEPAASRATADHAAP
jgi:nitric oxide reductase subunit B